MFSVAVKLSVAEEVTTHVRTADQSSFLNNLLGLTIYYFPIFVFVYFDKFLMTTTLEWTHHAEKKSPTLMSYLSVKTTNIHVYC